MSRPSEFVSEVAVAALAFQMNVSSPASPLSSVVAGPPVPLGPPVMSLPAPAIDSVVARQGIDDVVARRASQRVVARGCTADRSSGHRKREVRGIHICIGRRR